MKTSYGEARYQGIKWLLEHEGFYKTEIVDGKLIFNDELLLNILLDRGMTGQDIDRYIKEKTMERELK